MFEQPAPPYAWLDGELVPWERCVVHARTAGALWGATVFEGLRGYWEADSNRLGLFRGDDHLQRLNRSMRYLRLPMPFSDDAIREASLSLVRANGFREDVHVCIATYVGFGPGFNPLTFTEDVGLHITSTPAPRSGAYRDGVSAMVSSWRRIASDATPTSIKTGANYHNSRLAHHEAVRNGFDVAILLNPRGTVAEAADANIVLYAGGRLVAPPPTSGALEGITLRTVFELGHEMGIEVVRCEVDRTHLYGADEVFLCGTLAEIKPVISIDDLPIGGGAPGDITRSFQHALDTQARLGSREERWSTFVDPPETKGEP